MMLHLAGLLALLLFRRAFPSLWGKWLGDDLRKNVPIITSGQDYSYGDSSGIAPDSLLIHTRFTGYCNQMWRKPTVLCGIIQIGKDDSA